MRAPSRRHALGWLAGAAWLPRGVARAGPREFECLIEDFVFTPASLDVPLGARVTWINLDDEPHLVVASAGGFRSGPLDTGDRFAFVFAAPGRYEYFCGLHPHMRGLVTVAAGATDGARDGDD